MEDAVETKSAFSKCFVLLAIASLVLLFFNSGFFKIREVDVLNNSAVSDEEIILNSGLKSNLNLFQVNERQIISRLQKNPMIMKAQVKKFFPNKLLFTVEEREPACLLPTLGLEYLCLSKDGVAISADLHLGELQIPVVKGCTIRRVNSNGSLISPELQEILLMFSYFDDKLYKVVKEVDLRTYRLYIGDHGRVTVDLGSGEEIERKISNLRAIVNQLGTSEISAIDLRIPSTPTIIR